MSSSSTIHIIGAGVAGLAAGIAASEEGRRVVLYETAPQAGGRCRAFYDKKLGATIDNGNHLVMGANRSVLDYLRRIGTLELCITDTRPRYSLIDIANRQRHHFAPPRFRGIPAREWLHLLSLLRPGADKTVAQCIPPHTALYRRLVEPLTLAVLNTSPATASAQALSQVLHHLILGGKAAWRYYVPFPSLSAAFIDPALTRIKGRGGSIHYQQPIKGLRHKDGCITALTSHQREFAVAADDAVILAVPPAALQDLLPEQAPDFTYSPIVNAHFLWPQAGAFREMMPFLGVLGGTAQWIFFHDGRISTTTSAAEGWSEQDEATLARELWGDVCRALFMENMHMPLCRIIKEKRATYAATPENLAKRPGAATAFRNLFLAGDYLQSPFPATLEAAISSGFAAASLASRLHIRPKND